MKYVGASNFAPTNFALVRIANVKSGVWIGLPGTLWKVAPVKSAPVRLARTKFAPTIVAPANWALVRSACEKLGVASVWPAHAGGHVVCARTVAIVGTPDAPATSQMTVATAATRAATTTSP